MLTARATVVGSNYFAPKDVTGDTTTAPSTAAAPPATVAAPTPPTTLQQTSPAPSAPPAPAPAPTPVKAAPVTASTVTASAAPDWDDTARDLLPWVAVALLIATLVLITLARRRAY